MQQIPWNCKGPEGTDWPPWPWAASLRPLPMAQEPCLSSAPACAVLQELPVDPADPGPWADFPASPRTEPQNHRMVGVGRDLCGSSSPTLLPRNCWTWPWAVDWPLGLASHLPHHHKRGWCSGPLLDPGCQQSGLSSSPCAVVRPLPCWEVSPPMASHPFGSSQPLQCPHRKTRWCG